jgi:hypothetical protein
MLVATGAHMILSLLVVAPLALGADLPAAAAAVVSRAAPMHLPRHQLLDRWSQHTSTCPSCLAAHNNIQAAAAVAQVLALALVAAAAASLAVAGVTGPGLLLAAAAAAVGWLTRQLKALGQRFVFVDYGKGHPSKGP